eukprot:CAMPEP_0202690146 /NCGR_PEP_ID=MMETSP1385-20130828/5235_1 /ASSEMBLY_ACC=CAM_ASM_000861 /TAXON_ID=933848 /ORGANISM="Elphidium margaritaceum" /LENGTH=415 /DNA_ID=CAMNT_0049345379 /DNA_START=15 /DNA_END=1262 /DNA_ORIENTATION=+
MANSDKSRSASLIQLGDVDTANPLSSANDTQRTTVSCNNVAANGVTLAKHEPFIWLSTWISYLPCVVQTQWKEGDSKPRNAICNWTFLIISVLITFAELLWYSITPFFEYWADDWLYPLVYAVAMLLTTLAKCIALYYFWMLFDFRLLCTLSLDVDERAQSSSAVYTCLSADVLTSTIRKVNIRMKSILAALCTFLVALLCIKVSKIFSEQQGWNGLFKLIRSSLYYWQFDLPLFMAQFVLSILYLKGCLFVSSLTRRVQQNPAAQDLEPIYRDYSTFRKLFQNETQVLELMIKCRVLALIPWIWIDLTYVLETESALDGLEECIYLVMSSLPVIELVFGGSAATSAYHAFRTTIYDVQELSSELLYLLVCVAEFPFLVTLFAHEVSIKNAIKLTVAFIVAKAIAYLWETRAPEY